MKRTIIDVAIIGSGKLGTDLLIKVLRSPLMRCVLFIGRNEHSQGLIQARALGVTTSSNSIQAIEHYRGNIDIVFDVTSAQHHIQHASVFKRLGIKAIDLTPAKVGRFCVPTVNRDAILHHNNVNLVTCGGQSALPIIECIANIVPHISRIEVHSFLAEDSVGPGTIANIDEYYSTTQQAITEFTGVRDVDIQLDLEKSAWQPDMLTHIRLHTTEYNLNAIYTPLKKRLIAIQDMVSGYQIVGTPTIQNGVINIVISVHGKGDWLPAHAGNLDIINCAAISLAEHYAQDTLHGAIDPYEQEYEHEDSMPA